MIESEKAALEQAILSQHGVEARWVESVAVSERFEGRVVWEGDVHVCELADGRLCYGLTLEGKTLTVLGEAPLDSPAAAVRAAIASRMRRE